MSYGSGTIEGNTFVDAMQPIRGPYDNSLGGVFVIRSNVMSRPPAIEKPAPV